MHSNLVELGDYVKITSGYAFKSNLFNENGLGMPLIRIRDVTSGVIKTYFSGDYQEQYIVEPGDLLITMDGEFKIKKWQGEKALLNQRVCKIESNSDLLETDYLLYMLPTILKKIEDRTAFVTVKHLSVKEIQKSILNLPDIKTQKKIVEILNETALVIDKHQSQIAALEELTQSLFLEMFGDDKVKDKNYKKMRLQEIAHVGSSKRVFVDELVNEGIPFFRGTEIGDLAECNDISPELFITTEHYEKLKESSGIPKIGDLLMPSICPDGRIWRVDNDSPFYFKDGRVLWVSFKEEAINPLYIQFALKIKLIRDYLKIASGTTFAELKIFTLKNVELVIPPLELQNDFAEKLLVIRKQKENMKNSLVELESLYNALLQKAFKGELFQD